MPRFNGRPQLWTRIDLLGLRIIHGDGRVDYSQSYWPEGLDLAWHANGCTSRATQKEAVKACVDYCLEAGRIPPTFLGYL